MDLLACIIGDMLWAFGAVIIKRLSVRHLRIYSGKTSHIKVFRFCFAL